MGRKNKAYKIGLSKQVYNRLTEMQAFGESKREAMLDGSAKEKIFSYSTYRTYKKHIGYFVRWLKIEHPECTTLKAAKRYAPEWLDQRCNQLNKFGKHLSAWTIQTEAAALSKLFAIDKADPDRFQPPKRQREDIIRSRIETKRDRHFSETNNAEFVAFCKGTGCRRSVLERLEGRDLWTRDRMEEDVKALEGIGKKELTAKEASHLSALKDALKHFRDDNYFIHHRQDKGGRSRFAPIIGPDRDRIIQRFKDTGEQEKVWLHVNRSADIHSYRADYAGRVYRMYARDISAIPFDRVNKGTGHHYQSGVYVCRKDERGKKLDKDSMLLCSKALGHNRIAVVADHYLRSL